MRPPLSLPLAPPGDAPSAFVIFCSENTKIQVQQATPKVPPFTGRTIPPRYAVPSSNLLLCVFGCSPSWRGSHRPRACWLFWQCSYPPLKRCKARRTFRSFVPPLTEHLWTRFQTPITITVRQHRTYSYATVSSGYERARGTHASTTCKPSAAGSIVDHDQRTAPWQRRRDIARGAGKTGLRGGGRAETVRQLSPGELQYARLSRFVAHSGMFGRQQWRPPWRLFGLCSSPGLHRYTSFTGCRVTVGHRQRGARSTKRPREGFSKSPRTESPAAPSQSTRGRDTCHSF